MIMAIIKEIPIDKEEMENLFFAMGDKSRRQIVYSLMEESKPIKDLASPLGITITGATQHIKILEKANIVISRKIGRERVCEFNPQGFSMLENFAKFYREMWHNRFDTLRDIVEN